MFSASFDEELEINTTMQTNNQALQFGHNELDSTIITTTPIVPTAIIAAVNDDRIDHILGDNGQMATPMNIIANEFNINNGIATLDQDVTNISTISSTNAIIKQEQKQDYKRKEWLYSWQT